jgi:hypothetical protein
VKKFFRVFSRVVWFCFRRHRRFEDHLCLHPQGCLSRFIGYEKIRIEPCASSELNEVPFERSQLLFHNTTGMAVDS